MNDTNDKLDEILNELDIVRENNAKIQELNRTMAWDFLEKITAMESEIHRLKNPWTTITADPATLPPDGGGHLLLSLRVEDWTGDKWIVRENVTKGWYFDGQWQITTPGGSKIVPLYTLTSTHRKLIPYAWQPWPTPPPYPSAESQEQPR